MADQVLTVEVDKPQLANVRAMLAVISSNLPKVLAGAVNDTSRHEVSEMSKNIRDKVNIKKKDIDPYLKRTRASGEDPQSKITLSKSTRLSLKYFGARQTKKGVTYQIAKGGARQRIASAFIVQKLGGHVFKRKGKKRLPIQKLMGPSPWGVAVKAGLDKSTAADAATELHKNLDRRVRLELLRRAGVVNT